MERFPIRKGSQRPSLTVNLKSDDGSDFAITDALSATFTMYDSTGNKVDGSSAVIVDEDTGQLRYDWGMSDTDTDGKYYGYFTIVLGDSSILSVPARNELIIEVVDVEL